MSSYTPFNVPLKELKVEHFGVLRDVTEGWYVEYKREAPTIKSAAKSIAAFANTYGGWIFYGIEEKSRDEPIAGAFRGIPESEIENSLQRLRQAAAIHINPAPHFDIEVRRGPCAEIGLTDEMAIICVHVPQGSNAPYVNSNGVIYRRVGDSSEPKPETDRFFLDQLFQRGNKLREKYRKWLDAGPEFSIAETEQPYIRLMLVSDLWQDRKLNLDLNPRRFKELVSVPQILTGIPLDSFHTTTYGIIARQTKSFDPFNFNFTWQQRHDLTAEIIMPLKCYSGGNGNQIYELIKEYEHAREFSQIVQLCNLSEPRVVDLNVLYNALIGIVQIYERLMDEVGWAEPYFANAQILNTWRTVPFIDAKSIIEQYKEYGIPISQCNSITCRTGEPDTLFKVDKSLFSDKREDQIGGQAFFLFAMIANAYGIPGWADPDPEDTPSYAGQLYLAGQRAHEIQSRRPANQSPIQGGRSRLRFGSPSS